MEHKSRALNHLKSAFALSTQRGPLARDPSNSAQPLPPLVLLLCPAVPEGAVAPVGGRVTVGVPVRVTVAAGGRSVADLCFRNCRKDNTLMSLCTISSSLTLDTPKRSKELAIRDFPGHLTQGGGGPGILHLGHVGVVEEFAEEHEVAGIHQQRGLDVLVGHVTGQTVLKWKK